MILNKLSYIYMKRKAIMCLAIPLLAFGCTIKQPANKEIEIALPEDDSTETKYVDAIKDIEVIELQIDTNSIYNEDADLRVSDNYYYFLSKGLNLMCYEKATGKLLFSKNIKGRGRNECTSASCSFIIDDKIAINDVGKLKLYDHNGNYCGLLGDVYAISVLPLTNGFVNCDFDGTHYDTDKCIALFDQDFNVMGTYFSVPDDFKAGCHVSVSNTSPDRYVYNDTLRFMCQYTFRLHSFPGDKTYHFITSRPIPESWLTNPEEHSFITECMINDYASELHDLVENHDYISFKYMFGSGVYYSALLSKCNNKVYSIRIPRDSWNTPLDVWAVMMGSEIIYSDGEYFYARAHKGAFNFLDAHKDVLDDRQMSVYKTMLKVLENNKDCDFSFYYKLKF